MLQEIKKTNSEYEKHNNSALIAKHTGLGKPSGIFSNDFMKQSFGPLGNSNNDEVNNLRKKLEDLKLPEEAKKIVDQELNKVSKLSPSNQEYHVSINYLQTISDLPWNISDKE